MTVAQLIEKLSAFDPSLPVVVYFDRGYDCEQVTGACAAEPPHWISAPAGAVSIEY